MKPLAVNRNYSTSQSFYQIILPTAKAFVGLWQLLCPCVWCSCRLRKILWAPDAISPGPPPDFSCSWGIWLPSTPSASQHKCLLISSLFCLEVPNSKHPRGQLRTMVTRHQRESVPSDSHPLGRQFWGVFYMVSQRVPSGIWHPVSTVKTSTVTSQLLTSFPPHLIPTPILLPSGVNFQMYFLYPTQYPCLRLHFGEKPKLTCSLNYFLEWVMLQYWVLQQTFQWIPSRSDNH